MALTRYEEPSSSRAPSNTLWADCPMSLLIDNGTGIFLHEHFLGGVADTVAATEYRKVGPFSMDADDDTVLAFKASETGGYLDIETDSDDEDGWAIFTEPFAKLVKGRKVWIEGRLEIGAADADQGFFFGLAEEAAQSLDIMNNACSDLITETMIGFRIFTGEDAIDIIAQKDSSAEDVIASDVTNLDVIDTELGSGSKAVLTTDTEFKIGLRYDGDTTVHFYVNGVRVISWELDTTYYDPDKDLLFITSLKAGTTTAVSAAFDWIQVAALYGDV